MAPNGIREFWKGSGLRRVRRRSDYAKELRALKRELSLHLLIRSVLNRFQSGDYDRLLELLNEQTIQLLGAHNRDHISRILYRLLSAQPRLLQILIPSWTIWTECSG